MRKRFLSWMLVLSMAMTFLPVTAAATEVAAGSCGESVSWSLSGDGLLDISGVGAMAHYNSGDAP